MPKNPVAKNLAETAGETIEAAKKQIKEVGQDFIRQLYGTTDLSNEELVRKKQIDQATSAGDINAINEELRLHAGQSLGQTKNVSEQNKMLQAQQMFHAAQSLGVSSERPSTNSQQTEEEPLKASYEKQSNVPELGELEISQGRITTSRSSRMKPMPMAATFARTKAETGRNRIGG